jgi:hypothetical protein
MALARNVGKAEQIVRIIIGVGLILLGFVLTGFWGPAALVVGAVLVLTALVGYWPWKGLMLKVFSKE